MKRLKRLKKRLPVRPHFLASQQTRAVLELFFSTAFKPALGSTQRLIPAITKLLFATQKVKTLPSDEPHFVS
jgi:hypothetical protein